MKLWFGASRRPGLWSAVGLGVANMVGVGVLTSAGTMARRLGPVAILLAWLFGGFMAMAGARCYAALARAIPRSGGEYRYLSELGHPVLGYLAGWMSLLVGFAAPNALAAATAGPFFSTVVPAAPPALVGAALLVAAACAQAFSPAWSRATQDLLAMGKVLLFATFIVTGLALGSTAWPTWQPSPLGSSHGVTAHGPATTPLAAFAVSLVYVAYAYSGWNAPAYPAAEFRDSKRTVPAAMLIATGLVMALYLLVNWIFVANLTRDGLATWLDGDTARITLAHVLIADIAGPQLAALVSVAVVLALTSSISSMTLAGPRVLAEMAAEGLMPRWLFVARPGRPPTAAVLAQTSISLLLLLTHGFDQLFQAVGAMLTLVSAITVAGLFRLRWPSRSRAHLGAAVAAPMARAARPGEDAARPSVSVLACAALYIAGSCWMLWFAVREGPATVLWMAICAVAGGVAYRLSRGRAGTRGDHSFRNASDGGRSS